MAKSRAFFPRGRRIQTADRFVKEIQQAGLIMQRAGSGDGAEWVVDGQPLLNFASCSYLGLERHPDLIAGAESALHEYGSNFSISRAYLECPLYHQLEATLSFALDRPVLVTPSTTLGHLAALPVLVGDRDLVLLDQFAHASLHMATDLIADVPIELLRHSRTDLLEQRLQEASGQFERVWYVCDGVYSMLGDFAPFEALSDLLDLYPQLHLYVDDAHSMSWTGQNGRGAALSRLRNLDRVVSAVSLNKAFGASGGALALPTGEWRDRVRRCGGPMVFSGPIAPAGLGAALASAELHLRDELVGYQIELAARIAYVRNALAARGITLATDDETPIFMLHYDSAPAAFAAVRSLRERGLFCCPSTFPAVPMNKPSIRFTVSCHNPFDDLQRLVEHLSETALPLEQASQPEA